MQLISTATKAEVDFKSSVELSKMQQLMSVPPMEGRVRCSRALPALNLDRLKMAKAQVDKAVKERKVFSIDGPYPVIRTALKARGWVERRLPRHAPQGCRHGDQDAEGMEEADSDDDDGAERGQDKESDGTDDMSDLMVGLCTSLRNLLWYDSTDPDSFFPRCYRLGAEDEKHAFTEDFRRTACTSLLRYVVERAEGEGEDTTGELYNVKHSQGVHNQRKPQAKSKLGAGLIDTALYVCQEYLNSREHKDIDVALDSPPSLSEQQWNDFIQNYYLVIHDDMIIEGCSEYTERCKSMLTQMQKVCPQLETDGLSNIWIIKPGALSRGRGIVCMNRLEEILNLVDSDSALAKDSKWVVQKYIERPLLVHGTKFDLRQWFLVTDWNPLTVWFYDECYLRFSTQPYSTLRLDSSVHLCNNSIQKHFRASASRDPSLPAENMWSCSEFCSWLESAGRGRLWEELVLPGMRRAVVQTLLTAQDSVEPRKASFELYGADFILGHDLQPWLLEINVSPTMSPSTAVTARLCPAVQEDTLRVVLERRYNHNAHTGGFQLIYKQAAVEVPQYVGINLLVEGAQIRRPRVSPCKTFIHSQYELLRRSRPALKPSGLPTDEENQSEVVKRTWPSVSRKDTIERSSTSQPLLEKRRRRKALPSSSCLLPSLSDRHQLHTSHCHRHTYAEPSHTRSRWTNRTLLTLTRLSPSLEIISLQPGSKYCQSTPTHSFHTPCPHLSHNPMQASVPLTNAPATHRRL
ncbi:tubulin monoglycylase TTLL3 isoform X2 [Hoplias malabaricus]|uniref:tubulin monoglycylase TTLL3 isoform X2 n=1 Tax=Hoplias malabaricus TaxID=27720 RepID=UPI003461C579